MNLFDECKPEDKHERFGNYIENRYDYYVQSTKEKIINRKNVLEEWFQLHPIEEQQEIKSRIKKNEHFDSVVFEMFLFQKHNKELWDINIHPTLPHSSDRPDFSLRKNGVEMYLEAQVCYAQSETERSNLNKEKHLKDQINKFRKGKYSIGLTKIKIKTKESPSAKEFKQEIYNICESNIVVKKKLSFTNESIEIEYFFIRHSSEPTRFITSEFNELVWGSNIEPIRRNLIKKSKKYGDLNKPFIIAMEIKDFLIDKDDLENAIYGDEKYMVQTSPPYVSRTIRDDNGFFNHSQLGFKEKVSAVIFYFDIWNDLPLVCHNPNALYPIEQHLIPGNHMFIKDGILEEITIGSDS